MGQTLTNGVYLPDNGERNCYVGLSQNLQKLDNLLGNKGDKVSFVQTLTEGVEIGKITINGVDIAMYHTDYSDKADADNVYTKAEVDTSLSAKADKANTLSGYGITDAYTKTQVDTKVSELVNSAPETLDTLNELASALGNDPNFATTVANQIGTKANDSEVVHKSGNETIRGTKTFSDIIRSKQVDFNVDSSYYSYIQWSSSDNANRMIIYDYTDPGSYGEYLFKKTGLLPTTRNDMNLGSSTNKWKSLNGINPGALSLPISSSGINLDLTNFKKDGSNNIFKLTDFTNYPYDNGWLFVKLQGCTSYFADHWYKVVASTFATPSVVSFFIPITDNIHNIALQCVCTNIEYVKISPCQGNV